jgi:hypothetical protein
MLTTSSTSSRRPGSAERIDSLKALLTEDYDAIFVGSGAPRGRELEIPAARKHRPTSISASTGCPPSRSVHTEKIGKRVIVLGRRQHGDGLLPHLRAASAATT